MWSEHNLPLETRIAYELSENHRPLAVLCTFYNSIQWTSMFIMLVCAWWFSVLIKIILHFICASLSLFSYLCALFAAGHSNSKWMTWITLRRLFVNKTNNQAHLILPSFCFDDVLFIDSAKCHWKQTSTTYQLKNNIFFTKSEQKKCYRFDQFLVVLPNTQSTQWQLWPFLHVTDKNASLQLTSPPHTNTKTKNMKRIIHLYWRSEWKESTCETFNGAEIQRFSVSHRFLQQSIIWPIQYKGSHIAIENWKIYLAKFYRYRPCDDKRNAGNFRFHGLWCNFLMVTD